MEDITQTPASSAPIGVIDPSGTLAPVLDALGFTTFGGDEFRSAATAISEEASAQGTFPIVVVDHSAHGIDVWTDATARLTAVVTLTDGAGPLAARTDAIRYPTTVNTILTRLGLPPVADELDDTFAGNAATAEPAPVAPHPYLTLSKATTPASGNPYKNLRSRAQIAQATHPAEQLAEEPEQQPQGTVLAEPHSNPDTPAIDTPTATARTEDYLDADAAYFADRAQRRGRSVRSHLKRASHELADVLFVSSGKGGTGKSCIALQLAHYASETARDAGVGFRVTVIDGNRGQGDLRGYLWIPDDATLPSAYDAVVKDDPAAALIEPKYYGSYRKRFRLEVPDFSVVLTPPPRYATSQKTPGHTYLDLITHAREVSDLVIVDTQLLEAEKTDLWRQAFLPTLLGPGAWLLCTANESAPAINNLDLRLSELVGEHSLPKSRVLLLATMFEQFQAEDEARFAAKLGRYGQIVGATGYDPEVREAFNTGRIESRFPSTEPALRIIVNQVTGRYDLFDPAPEPTRPSLVGFLRRKKPTATTA